VGEKEIKTDVLSRYFFMKVLATAKELSLVKAYMAMDVCGYPQSYGFLNTDIGSFSSNIHRKPRWISIGLLWVSIATDNHSFSTPLCDTGGSFWKVGITADLFARVAMPIFHGLWTFHI